MNKIGGLEYQDYNSDGYIYRMVTIKKMFPRRFRDKKLYNTVGLNAKFIDLSRRDRVHKIVVRLENAKGLTDVKYLDVPTVEQIYDKVKYNEYEDKPSKFVDGSPMRIYGFPIN